MRDITDESWVKRANFHALLVRLLDVKKTLESSE